MRIITSNKYKFHVVFDTVAASYIGIHIFDMTSVSYILGPPQKDFGTAESPFPETGWESTRYFRTEGNGKCRMNNYVLEA